jgi:hypothetical protein
LTSFQLYPFILIWAIGFAALLHGAAIAFYKSTEMLRYAVANAPYEIGERTALLAEQPYAVVGIWESYCLRPLLSDLRHQI